MSVVSSRKAFPSLRENTSNTRRARTEPPGNQQTQPNHSRRRARRGRKNNNENPELLEKGRMRSRRGSIMDRASSGGQMAEQADRTGREADRRERGKANGRAAHQPASCPQATRRRAGGRPAAGARGGQNEARADGRGGGRQKKRGERTRSKRTAARAETAGERGRGEARSRRSSTGTAREGAKHQAHSRQDTDIINFIAPFSSELINKV